MSVCGAVPNSACQVFLITTLNCYQVKEQLTLTMWHRVIFMFRVIQSVYDKMRIDKIYGQRFKRMTQRIIKLYNCCCCCCCYYCRYELTEKIRLQKHTRSKRSNDQVKHWRCCFSKVNNSVCQNEFRFFLLCNYVNPFLCFRINYFFCQIVRPNERSKQIRMR